MKKIEKLTVIQSAIEGSQLCSCNFVYENDLYYYYPISVTDKFLLAQEEDDFILDGYAIRKISQLKKVSVVNNACQEINKLTGLTNKVVKPAVDLTDWQSIFVSLQAIDTFVIIEDEYNDFFVIGKIKKALKNKLYFEDFDANGNWNEQELEIPYSAITCVKWNTRYDTYWKKYLDSIK